MNWNVNKYFSPTEPPIRWNLRKAFMETHKEKFSEDRLVCLSQLFCNIEFLGCRYSDCQMELVELLAIQVPAVRKYREDKVNSLKRTFILASDAVKKCSSNESTCIDAKKLKTVVEEDGVSTSFVSGNITEGEYLTKSQQQPGWKGKIVIFEDPNCVQSPYSKCVNACMKAGLAIKIIKTGKVKDLLREYALTIDSESIELCCAENEKKAREQLGQKVLDLFKKYCFTIVTKNKYDGEQIEKQQSTIPESSTLPENNIGTKMMKSMGWCGQGLGKNQSGIKNPIEIQENVNRLGLGGSKNCKNMVAQINQYLENYARKQHTHSLVFSPDFTNDERKFIHEAARRLNLQSKSHGKGTNRQLTVQRKLSAWKLVEDLLAVGGSTGKYDLIKPTAL